MNAKTLALMVLCAALFWGGTQMLQSEDSKGSADKNKSERLFPDLQAQVNGVRGLELTTDEGLLHFSRNAKGLWTLKEREDYPADRQKLDGLVLALARSERLEQKTSKPAKYAALGLATVATGNGEDSQAAAVTVKITNKNGDMMASLWVGKRRGRSQTEAYFVRKQDEPDCWAASGNLALETNLVNWLESTLLNVSSGEVQAVRITHPDGQQVLLSRPEGAGQNTPLTILNIPEGMEPQSEWVTSRFASALQGFKMQDVQSASSIIKPPGQTIRSEFWTTEGLLIMLDTWETDGSIYANLEADVSTEGERLGYTGPEVNGQAAIDLQGNPNLSGATPSKDMEAEAKRLNRVFAGWVYELPSWKGAALRGRMEELLKAEDDGADPFGDALPSLQASEPEQVLTVKPGAPAPEEPAPKPVSVPEVSGPMFEIDPEAVKPEEKRNEGLDPEPK